MVWIVIGAMFAGLVWLVAQDAINATSDDAELPPKLDNWYPNENPHEVEERRSWASERALSRLTVVLNALTLLGAVVGVYIAYNAFLAADQSVKEAKRQAMAAEEQLTVVKLDQRPWIKIEKVSPARHPNPESDVAFSGLRWWKGDDAPGVVPLKVEIRNVGKAPALEIRIGAWALIDPGSNAEQAIAEQQERCDKLDKSFPSRPAFFDGPNLPQVIFPGDVEGSDSALVVIPASAVKGKDRFQFWFYGCVSYRFSGSDKPGITPFAYRVARIVKADIPGGKAKEVLFRGREDVPVEEISFEARPWASGNIR